MAFNGIGACTAPSAADESSANCTGSITDNGTTYTDPGQAVDSSYPNDAGLVNALLADQADFNWIIHTWSHLFLGCQVWSPQALTSVTANGSGGTFTAGTLQLRDHRGHRLRRVGALHPADSRGRHRRLGHPDLARGHQRHRHRRYARTHRWPRKRPATPAAPGSGATTSTVRTRAPPPTAWSARWQRTRRRPPPPRTPSPTRVPRPAPSPTRARTSRRPPTPASTAPSAAGSWVPATQHHARLLDRAGDRPRPGVGRGQRAHQLHSRGGRDRRALRRREPEHAGRPGRGGRDHLRPGRLPAAAAVLPGRRPGGAPVPEQHLLQRGELARRAERVQHAVRSAGRLARQLPVARARPGTAPTRRPPPASPRRRPRPPCSPRNPTSC